MADRTSIGTALAKKIAHAVCGDDHLMCSWPTCACKSTKQKINAVGLVVAEHLDSIEDAVDIVLRGDNAGRALLASDARKGE
jgi:hypothetical protein